MHRDLLHLTALNIFPISGVFALCHGHRTNFSFLRTRFRGKERGLHWGRSKGEREGRASVAWREGWYQCISMFSTKKKSAKVYVVKVDGATPKRWLSKGPWQTNTWELELHNLLSTWYIYFSWIIFFQAGDGCWKSGTSPKRHPTGTLAKKSLLFSRPKNCFREIYVIAPIKPPKKWRGPP